MPDFYRIFDTTLGCDFLLPELPGVQGEDHVISVTLGEGGPDRFDSQGFVTAFEWLGYEGGVVCWCERKGDEGC